MTLIANSLFRLSGMHFYTMHTVYFEGFLQKVFLTNFWNLRNAITFWSRDFDRKFFVQIVWKAFLHDAHPLFWKISSKVIFNEFLKSKKFNNFLVTWLWSKILCSDCLAGISTRCTPFILKDFFKSNFNELLKSNKFNNFLVMWLWLKNLCSDILAAISTRCTPFILKDFLRSNFLRISEN